MEHVPGGSLDKFWRSHGGWSPQQNMDLTTTNWETPLEAVNDDGTNKFIVVDRPVGERFYRLVKP